MIEAERALSYLGPPLVLDDARCVGPRVRRAVILGDLPPSALQPLETTLREDRRSRAATGGWGAGYPGDAPTFRYPLECSMWLEELD